MDARWATRYVTSQVLIQYELQLYLASQTWMQSELHIYLASQAWMQGELQNMWRVMYDKHITQNTDKNIEHYYGLLLKYNCK
jgi:hypothetical protein